MHAEGRSYSCPAWPTPALRVQHRSATSECLTGCALGAAWLVPPARLLPHSARILAPPVPFPSLPRPAAARSSRAARAHLLSPATRAWPKQCRAPQSRAPTLRVRSVLRVRHVLDGMGRPG